MIRNQNTLMQQLTQQPVQPVSSAFSKAAGAPAPSGPAPWHNVPLPPPPSGVPPPPSGGPPAAVNPKSLGISFWVVTLIFFGVVVAVFFWRSGLIVEIYICNKKGPLCSMPRWSWSKSNSWWFISTSSSWTWDSCKSIHGTSRSPCWNTFVLT